MNFNRYQISDFLDNADFRDWVLTPNSELEAYWLEWIKDHPEAYSVIEQARKVLLDLEAERKEVSQKKREKLWNRIEETNQSADNQKKDNGKVLPIHPRYANLGTPKKKTVKRRTLLINLGVAASLLIIGVFITGYFFGSNTKEVKEEILWVRKQNPKGQKSKIKLPDGSKVTLNAESELLYKEKFEGITREVFLEGEAFFEVEKNTEKPFVVHSADVLTTALGTSFNIKYTEDGSPLKVSLVTGKVKVEGPNGKDDKHIITPGEQLKFDLLKHTTHREMFNPTLVLAWKNNIISFQNADQEEVFSTLSRWYGVEFDFQNTSDKIREWRYSGQYKDESLERVLDGLSFTQGFSYTIEDKHVTINYKP